MCAISDYLHARAVCQQQFQRREPRDWSAMEDRWWAMSPAQREYISNEAAMGPHTIYTDPFLACHPPLRPQYRIKMFAIIESLGEENGDA